ncbi:MAG: hypothetical protein RBR86_02865 [Pseudobdellovibrionaceae bacterium]|jgi:hypothetical protein|nr:hypothetical protein [Pseudobdellovibrionaceae bacterium]
MAHDIELSDARFPLEQFAHLADTTMFTPMKFDLEPELKLALPQRFTNVHSLNEAQAKYMKQGAKDDLRQIAAHYNALIATFNNASGGQGASVLDANGPTPRDYVLVSLGQDTLRLFPTASIRDQGLQYRERFAVKVFGKETGSITNHDANAKSLLSHGPMRKEFEVACTGPTNSFHEFRQIQGLPEFFHTIDPSTLYVDAVCLTSRTSLFSLNHIPGTNLLALLEHCCDISRFSTPNLDVFTSDHFDREWETEVKGFYGVDQRLETEEGIKELVQTLFSHLEDRLKQAVPGIKVNTLSKMERASKSVDEFYMTHGPLRHIEERSRLLYRYCASTEIPMGLAYALSQRVSALEIHNNPDRLYNLAAAMPNPETLIRLPQKAQHVGMKIA